MNQRRGVNDLNHRAQLDRALAGVVHQLGGEQQQGRAQTLTAADTKIFADFGDGANAGDGVASELALDGSEIVVQQVEDFFRVPDYRVQAFVASTPFHVARIVSPTEAQRNFS